MSNVKQKDSDIWAWRDICPFSHALEVGNQVFISGQPPLDASGNVVSPNDIAGQTRCVFENMIRVLESRGLSLNNLIRLNTYYVFDGEDDKATEYWEEMTRIRLEYFPDPGPAATAVRIKGMPYVGQLIQIEGIAVKGADFQQRVRVMPEDSWDWSISVPLSQGWRCDKRIYVGGQISADKKGSAVHAGDVVSQTNAIYDYIDTIVSDAGGCPDDIAHLKICFKHDSSGGDENFYLKNIIEVTKNRYGRNCPVISCFGVDLLYPGLVLEIDAMAFDATHSRVSAAPSLGKAFDDCFADGVTAAGETWIGGQEAIDNNGRVMCEGNTVGQAEIVFEKLKKLLGDASVELTDIVRLNMFFLGEHDISTEFHAVMKLWQEFAPKAKPTMTAVKAFELSSPGVKFMADCVAIKN